MTAKIRTYHNIYILIYLYIFIYNVHNIFVEFGDAPQPLPKKKPGIFKVKVKLGPSAVYTP